VLVGLKINGRILELLPELMLLHSENRILLEQGANAVAPDFGCGMKPAEEAHAREAARQDVLEKAADQFGGLQGNGLVVAGVGVAIRPEHLAGGEDLQGAVAGGRFEYVSSQVSQGVLSGADGLRIDSPVLFPYLLGQSGESFRVESLQVLAEESAKVGCQRLFRKEELWTAGHPLPLVQAQAAARDQVMEMGMEDEGAGPGVQNGEHAQLSTQALGMAARSWRAFELASKRIW
jgi:hypothetical protein